MKIRAIGTREELEQLRRSLGGSHKICVVSPGAIKRLSKFNRAKCHAEYEVRMTYKLKGDLNEI